MDIITKSARETQKLGEKLANNIISLKKRQAVILALYGDLGSGKTTFIQGLARGLGIKKRILSPTFIMMREYEVREYRVQRFYHIDLYRIESLKDTESLGLSEILLDSKNVVAIEWPEKTEKKLPKNNFKIKFEYIDEKRRKIVIDNFS